MREFLTEWFHLASKPAPWLYHGWEAFKTTIFWLLGFGAFGTLAYFLNSSLPVPWWALLLVGAVLCYLSATAGLAWEFSRGASVEIGPVLYDAATRTFMLLLTNGEKEASQEMQINNVFKSDGRRLLTGPVFKVARFGTPYVHFREHEERQYPLCKLSRSSAGNPCLIVDNPMGGDPIVASDEVVLPKQTPIRFQLIVTTQSSPYGKPPKRRTYRVAITFTADGNSEPCYQWSIS